MSRTSRHFLRSEARFPRVSGDEPPALLHDSVGRGFSPRERG